MPARIAVVSECGAGAVGTAKRLACTAEAEAGDQRGAARPRPVAVRAMEASKRGPRSPAWRRAARESARWEGIAEEKCREPIEPGIVHVDIVAGVEQHLFGEVRG